MPAADNRGLAPTRNRAGPSDRSLGTECADPVGMVARATAVCLACLFRGRRLALRQDRSKLAGMAKQVARKGESPRASFATICAERNRHLERWRPSRPRPLPAATAKLRKMLGKALDFAHQSTAAGEPKQPCADDGCSPEQPFHLSGSIFISPTRWFRCSDIKADFGRVWL